MTTAAKLAPGFPANQSKCSICIEIEQTDVCFCADHLFTPFSMR
jgi:hypothetical protein